MSQLLTAVIFSCSCLSCLSLTESLTEIKFTTLFIIYTMLLCRASRLPEDVQFYSNSIKVGKFGI
jgi:hypothetical protein